jgi:hypothetical protein
MCFECVCKTPDTDEFSMNPVRHRCHCYQEIHADVSNVFDFSAKANAMLSIGLIDEKTKKHLENSVAQQAHFLSRLSQYYLSEINAACLPFYIWKVEAPLFLLFMVIRHFFVALVADVRHNLEPDDDILTLNYSPFKFPSGWKEDPMSEDDEHLEDTLYRCHTRLEKAKHFILQDKIKYPTICVGYKDDVYVFTYKKEKLGHAKRLDKPAFLSFNCAKVHYSPDLDYEDEVIDQLPPNTSKAILKKRINDFDAKDPSMRFGFQGFVTKLYETEKANSTGLEGFVPRRPNCRSRSPSTEY